LEVFEANLVAIHGGTIEAHVARKGSRPIGVSVHRIQKSEAMFGFGDIKTYHRFAAAVLALQDQLLDVLRAYQRHRKSVWAYGAPAKGATLLNSFGIGPDLVQKAVEKNPMKIGLAIPGVRIPIEAEGGPWPDAYLMLAWNFIDEFLKKEADYLDAGGVFIVPIPQVREITKDSSA
jgi:hypothetical protein